MEESIWDMAISTCGAFTTGSRYLPKGDSGTPTLIYRFFLWALQTLQNRRCPSANVIVSEERSFFPPFSGFSQ